MIHAIKKSRFKTIKPLFAPLEKFQPMCSAVLDGIWPGEVWGDDPENPQSAMLVTFLSGGGAAWCFLAGKPDNASYNAALNKALFEERLAGTEVSFFLFTCATPEWDKNLPIIGNPRQPAPMHRHHYVCRSLPFHGAKHLPKEYTIHPMRNDLFNQADLQIPDSVSTTLNQWASIEEDRFQDFGFVVVHERQVVAWATVDFVNAGSGDLGFETLSEFRQRGLGSAVAAAALEHGIQLGIEVHWTCAADNIASQRTAQKLGLTLERDYTMHVFALDLSEHLTQLAYSYLAEKKYSLAIKSYEQLFAQTANVPVWAYFDTAQAWAALENSEKAFQFLKMAAKNGWSAVDITEQTPEFKSLHDSPEWDVVITRIRTNQKN